MHGTTARTAAGRGLVLAGLLLLFAWVAFPLGATAHALLVSSDPPAGATLAHSPSRVLITFTERPDPRLSSIRVIDSSGRLRAGGSAAVVAGQPVSLQVPVGTLPDGVYTVSWRTVSRVDGHLASGAYSFGVGASAANAPPPKVSSSGAPRPGGLAVAGRWVYFAGLIGLLGLAITDRFIASPLDGASPPSLERALDVAWFLAVAGTLLMTEAQRRAARVPVGHLLSSSLGHSLELRGLPVLLAGAVLLLGARRASSRVVLAGVVALAMLGDVATSHAAASPSWEWFREGTQWVHFMAVGVWIGGLVGLLLLLRSVSVGERRRLARRYSFLAGLSLLVVAATGSVRAFDEIGTWHELFHTGFGQAVAIKIVLITLVAVLGGLNRYRSVPAVSERPTLLARVAGSELALVAVVLAVTAVLQNLAPSKLAAASTAAPALRPVFLEAADFGTTVRLALEVSPATPGFNLFGLTVRDYDTGQAIAADSVSIRFHAPDRPGLGDSDLTLVRSPDGSYRANGPNLSIQGRWQLTVLVQRASQSVEVPLTLVTQSPPQPTDVQPNPGLPTIYNVHLPGSRQVQIYLDPGHDGKNEFHATFLDATGHELNMASFAASAARESSGPAEVLTTRKLDAAGHYVADASLSRGRYRFSATGATADGEALGATVDLTVT